jgi:cobaltochelatase CobT
MPIRLSKSTSIDGLTQAWQRTYAGEQHSEFGLSNPLAPVKADNRSGGDAIAAWLKHHNPQIDTHFTEQEWPWYAALERARVEIIATDKLPGMAHNLAQLGQIQPADGQLAHVYSMARQVFAGNGREFSCEASPSMSSPAPTPTRTRTPKASWFSRLNPFQPKVPESRAISLGEIAEYLSTASSYLQDAEQFADKVRPLVQLLASDNNSIPLTSPITDKYDVDGSENDTEEHAEATKTLAGSADTQEAQDDNAKGYRVYSRQWDEVLLAARLSQPEDELLFHELNQQAQYAHIRRLALQLQRLLLAPRLRQWAFNQEEGVLDNRQLAQLVIPDGHTNIFRRERESPVPEACVTLLIDQSGSMRGERQRIATLAVDLAVQTMESCGIKTEVLGYTTTSFEDNPVAQTWEQVGKPAAPGRLNALRHIIYKRAEQPWKRVRRYLGLTLREGFGCENIDGEALEWAAKRLAKRPEPRKVLIILSDGIPYDKATVDANDRMLLESHLHEIIQQIEDSPIQLAAIGTGQDVKRFYQQALTVKDPVDVADKLFNHLGELLLPTTH